MQEQQEEERMKLEEEAARSAIRLQHVQEELTFTQQNTSKVLQKGRFFFFFGSGYSIRLILNKNVN